MSDHIEHNCKHCGDLLHTEDNCPHLKDTPNQNNELAKAIEHLQAAYSTGEFNIYLREKDVRCITLAAKRSQELEKERDEFKEKCRYLAIDERQHWTNFEKKAVECVGLKIELGTRDKQLATITTEYKKTLEALQQSISIAEDALDYRPDDENEGRWQTIKSGLATPLAISVMKGDKT